VFHPVGLVTINQSNEVSLASKAILLQPCLSCCPNQLALVAGSANGKDSQWQEAPASAAELASADGELMMSTVDRGSVDKTQNCLGRQ
jgi:hypothetical protein